MNPRQTKHIFVFFILTTAPLYLYCSKNCDDSSIYKHTNDQDSFYENIVIPSDWEQTPLDLFYTYSMIISATDKTIGLSLIKRDASGDFSARNITANLIGNITGNASTAITSASCTGTARAAIVAHKIISDKLSNIYIGSTGASNEAKTIRLGTTGTHTVTHIAGGVNIATNAIINGTLAVGGATALSSLTTSGSTILNSINVKNTAIVNGSLGISGPTMLNNNFTTTGWARIAGAGTGLAVANNTTINGQLNVSGPINTKKSLNLTGSGSSICLNNKRLLHSTGNNDNSNTFLGLNAGATILTATGNTAIGAYALLRQPKGINNTSIGYGAGSSLQIGNNNIYIGNMGKTNESSIIRLGTAGTHTMFIAAGVATTNIAGGSILVADQRGTIGTILSSNRFKTDIADLPDRSNDLLALRPVSFKMKNNQNSQTQYGLIAEEVEKTLPELVIYDQTGKAISVAYHLLPILLLQHQQKSHELFNSKINQLQDEIMLLRDAISHLQA